MQSVSQSLRHIVITGTSGLTRKVPCVWPLIHKLEDTSFCSYPTVKFVPTSSKEKWMKPFCDLQGETGITNDTVVYGYKNDCSDHNENLHVVLQCARETGLHSDLVKCKFRDALKFPSLAMIWRNSITTSMVGPLLYNLTINNWRLFLESICQTHTPISLGWC